MPVQEHPGSLSMRWNVFVSRSPKIFPGDLDHTGIEFDRVDDSVWKKAVQIDRNQKPAPRPRTSTRLMSGEKSRQCSSCGRYSIGRSSGSERFTSDWLKCPPSTGIPM